MATNGPSPVAGDLAARIDHAVAEERVWNLHGVVVLRGGRTVLERYFEGEDNARGRPLGRVGFGPETLHDLRSVSKSVVGLLYGIALARGQVPPPQAPLSAAFPEHADLAGRPGRDRITVEHALTMTLGLDWDETSRSYADPENSEIAMDQAPDPIRFVLERPVVRPPGERFTYCGGATALLARLIARGTGQSLHAFAREALFDPLGLGPSEWAAAPGGEPYAASGLRMTPRDLARIGTMVAGRGSVDGRQVVPAAWIAAATTPAVSVDEIRRFGYHWYVWDVGSGKPLGWLPEHLDRVWACYGEGGQRLFVLPQRDLVVAVTAGNYLAEDQWIPPNRVLREIVLPGLS
ncbi:serine hydrolase domain-containing protein [Methylobacterium sp. ID0610]|uniref:serine hydrolase domain-containing protein n=1 Tax=Methylobacterium carpenticola TaxID=3344827 RepID=UPI003684CA09